MQEITGAKPVRDANFIVPKALSAMHSLGKRTSSCNSGWGLQFRNRRSRTSVQAGVISQPGPGQHRGLRPFLPPCSSLWISFVKRPCRCNSGGRLQSFCSRTQRRGTTSRTSPVQVRALPRAPFWPASIKVMHRTFNPLNRERYPGGPPIYCRVV